MGFTYRTQRGASAENSIKEILIPAFFAIPIDMIFAEAPIMVIFPPKHAPNANAHQSKFSIKVGNGSFYQGFDIHIGTGNVDTVLIGNSALNIS